MNIMQVSLAEKSIFDKTKLIVSCIEKIKRDIEILFPKDPKAIAAANELLYHFVWKMAEEDAHGQE